MVVQQEIVVVIVSKSKFFSEEVEIHTNFEIMLILDIRLNK